MNKYIFTFTIIAVVIIVVLFVCAAVFDTNAFFVTKETESEKPEEPKELRCYTIYDVPLGRELQIFTQDVCKRYKVDYELVLAVIQVESSFNPKAYNEKTDCSGLMQVNGINLPELSEELDVNYLFDPYENVIGGVYLLSKASVGCDTEHALMIYNCGLTGARKLWCSGIHSTDYTRKVLAAKNELRVKERIYE